MPTVHTSPRALEAVAAPQIRTTTDTATNVVHKSAETAQHLVEQAVRAVHTAVQQAGQNFDLTVQLTGTAVSSSQAVQSALSQHVQQAVQRTRDALTQASQVRSPSALLDLQSSYVTDNLQAVLATHARLAQIAADAAQQAADQLQPRAA
jgi:hypothetical protein